MDKKLLQKIYTLKKVQPDGSFKESAKHNILQRDVISDRKTFWTYLEAPINQTGLVTAGVFAFMIVFVSLVFPLSPNNSEDNREYREIARSFPIIETMEIGEELRMVSESEEESNIVGVAEETPIKKEFASFEQNYRNIQREVLGTIVMEGEEKRDDLTDREIAEYLISEMEKGNNTDKGMILMMTEEDNEKDRKIEEAKESFENEDYENVFDIFITR